MAGNFGIGLGSFMSGFTEGANAAQGIKRGMQQEKLTNMQIKNLEDQQTANQGAKDISAQGVADAQKNTDGNIDNVMTNYMQNTAPKLQQYWMANGDVDKANAFGKWINDTNVQQGMKYGAGMIRAAQLGDPDGVMKNMVNLYNQPGYFEDGHSAVGATLRKDKDGNAAGMDITLRNDKTGEETTQTFNSMDDVYKTAMQFGQPQNVFNYGIEQMKAGEKARVDMAKEGRDWQRDNQKAERDQGYKLEGQNNASQLRQAEKVAEAKNGTGNKKISDAKATIQFLKDNGASDDYIRTNMAGILGIENRQRPLSSRIDDYVKMRTDSDPKFRKLPLDEQIQQAQGYISAVDRQSDEAAPQSVGLPAGGQAAPTGQAGGNGVLFLDTKTGNIISR